MVEKCADDNWGKLYQAILDFNQPPSVVANALQFREEIPALDEGSGSTLTPPLSDNFDWSVRFQPLAAMRHQSPSSELPQSTPWPPRLRLRTMMRPQSTGNPYN